MSQEPVTYEDMQELLKRSPHAAAVRTLSCNVGAILQIIVTKGIATEGEVLDAIALVEREIDAKAMESANSMTGGRY